MPAESGRGFLIEIGDGQVPETFSPVAGLRSSAITIDAQAVEITNKDSAGWRELLSGAGVRRIAVSGSGVFWDSAAEAGLRAAALAGTLANYRIVFENGDRFEGPFLVASLDYSGDHDGERTYTLSLESAGPVAFAAGSGV